MNQEYRWSLVKKVAYLVIVIWLLQVIGNYVYMFVKYDFQALDFHSFYSAAQILVNEPKNLYNFQIQEQYQNILLTNNHLKNLIPGNEYLPFINPPLFLLPYLVLIQMPFNTAYYLTVFINICLTLTAMGLLYKLFQFSTSSLLLVGLLVFSFAPTFSTIFLAQSSLLTLLIFLGIYILLKHQKYFYTGLLASLLLYKPQMALVMIIYLIFMKNRSVILGLIIGSLTVLVVCIILTQGHLPNLIVAIPEFLAHTSTGPSSRVSWLGFFAQVDKYIGNVPVLLLCTIFSILTIIWSLLAAATINVNSSRFPLVYSIVIITTLLSGIHMLPPEIVLLIFPLFYFLKHHYSTKLLVFIFIGWVIYLLSIFNFLTPLYPQRLPFLPTLYLVLFLYLLIRQLKTIQKT